MGRVDGRKCKVAIAADARWEALARGGDKLLPTVAGAPGGGDFFLPNRFMPERLASRCSVTLPRYPDKRPTTREENKRNRVFGLSLCFLRPVRFSLPGMCARPSDKGGPTPNFVSALRGQAEALPTAYVSELDDRIGKCHLSRCVSCELCHIRILRSHWSLLTFNYDDWVD